MVNDAGSHNEATHILYAYFIYFNTQIACLDVWFIMVMFDTLGPEQNGYPVADNKFKCILLNENACIFIEISLINLTVQLTISEHWCR